MDNRNRYRPRNAGGNWRNRNRNNNDNDNDGNAPNKPNGNRGGQRANQNNRGSNQRRGSNGSGGHQRSVDRDRYSGKYFNFIRLDQLSKLKDDDVVTKVAEKKSDFEELLNNDMTPDILVVTLRVLTKVCRANFTEIVTGVLSNACSRIFLKSLFDFLTKLPFEDGAERYKNKLYHQDKNGFWSNLIEFFKKVMELLPSKARDELTTILQKINRIATSIELSQDYKIDEKIKKDASAMLEELEEEIKKLDAKSKKIETHPEEEEIEEKPPGDFRELSVIPTVQDLYDPKPFIRPCKIKDAYDSIEHYLDVQFRLLREDFVAPLRNGIQEYLQGERKYRNHDLRIYRKVRLIAPDVGKNKNNVGVTVSFGVIKNIRWRNSKRFMYGGLLLLSRDNFNTILFATVANRDEKDLEKGFVLIEPCEGSEITRDLYDIDFVMLESKIYFEPYLAVLNAMKGMNKRNFPMENYLVHADTSVRLPRYLEENQMLKHKNFRLPVGENQIWPTAEKLNLDETQYNAFRCALTQEFAVIQGPPGTGKTFIALKIVETLLENSNHWSPHGPIVVVCLTNHALDQFLEGILRYTKSIVRIGARSKSEALKPYTLMERRKTIGRHERTNAWCLMHETKHEYENVLCKIEKTRLTVQYLRTPNAIVPLCSLQEYCYDVELMRFSTNEELVNWLIGIDLIPIAHNPPAPRQPENPAEIIPAEEEPEDDPNIHMDDELELTYKFQVDNYNKPIFPLQSIDAFIGRIRQQIIEYRNAAPEMIVLPFDPTIELEEDLNTLITQRLSLQHLLDQHPLLRNHQRYATRNPRWRRYWNWVTLSYENAMNQLTDMNRKCYQLNLALGEAKQLVDLAVLRKYHIIGLTTTAAAKQHASLRSLNASIVLVEEAAEILEAHVVCSLTKGCLHTILIGDHKQLRPKASVYKLGVKFNLNVSLFERMVNIRGDCTQLAHQHRMRPEIARLIHPSIYNVLYNHESVLDYPNVYGVAKNLFFINHNNSETSHNDEESWVNKHEAQFLVAFARHLILQGYDGEEISILCTYTGQLFALMKETDRYPMLRGVRVTTIDNYQGEENRIILLSLVRNNGEGNIGFLKEENRVCVALSRAREGLYIMGNMADLVIKNDIWPKIKEVLEDENAIGDSLELRCQIHADQTTQMQTVNDFQKCPEGGCMKKCEADLRCGHSCTSICHTLDREHDEIQCKQPCIKSCPYDHPCPLKCWQGCKPCNVMVERELKCGHVIQMPCGRDPETFPCYIEVDAVLPDCNHDIKKPCYRPLKNCKCPHPCEIRLPCGHSCESRCHTMEDPDHIEYKCYKDCTKRNVDCENHHPCKKRCHEKCEPCPIIVEKTRSCGHYYKKIKCSINVEAIDCIRPCKLVMSCGHRCKRMCSAVCGNCTEKVNKVSSCGHTVKVKCCEEATPAKCGGNCQRKLACGHSCTAKCKEPCITDCKNMVKQTEPGLCGHIFSVPCYLQNKAPKSELLKYCKEPCKTILACEHRCVGRCGTCKQGRIHVACAQPCSNILICGHKCEVPCRLECQPCKQPCQAKCRHSKCGKKCGMPCTPCKEPCVWGCKHRKCTNRCYELCNIEPCNEPCKKKLKCNHECVGFCGDPCPPLCRICDKDDLTEVFFGNEDEPDARFIFLEDCSHCIESEGLSTWVSQSNESIQMKTCPRCKTPIRKCMRMMNQIKKDMNDLQLVKKKVFGNQEELKRKQIGHLRTIQDLISNPIVTEFSILDTLLQKLFEQGAPVKNKKTQNLNTQEVEALRITLQILSQMIEILKPIKKSENSLYRRIAKDPTTVAFYKTVKDQVAMLAESIPMRGSISKQEIADITLELDRLSFMVEICIIDAKRINDGIVHLNQTGYNALIAKVVCVEKYTETKISEIRTGLKIYRDMNDVKVERAMIVKAMGLTQGHWFKCPNDHIYAIGDCGGAMERGICPECKEEIGGESHRLVNTNSLASEMDGATRSAWPGTY